MIRDFEEPKTDKLGLPEGMVEYDLRVAMRNFLRANDWEELRRHVADLMDEFSGRRLF